MYRRLVFTLGMFLFGSQPAFSQTAPVKYLAGRSEAGQPHLYWFGAAATESILFFDDGVKDEWVFVSQQWDNDQVLVRFSVNSTFFRLTEISAFIYNELPGDTSSRFMLSVRKDTSGLPPGAYLHQDTLKLFQEVQDSGWVKSSLDLLIVEDTSFWGALHWSPTQPTNPRIGEDRSGNSGRNFIGYGGNYFIWNHGGNRMIRAKVLINNLASEMADSFWVYRGVDSNIVFHVATIDSGLFDYLDTPPNGDDYYYRISRWENGVESPLSNATRLTASPTAVEDKQTEKHAFLLSEPFPNPTSASVLFTARTDRQMELGFSICNLLGQNVFSKSATGYPAGEHRFFWNGQDGSGRRLPSGLYLLRFQAGGEILVKKVTLLH